ncbi:Uncharacterised protein [uncultured archaeon]|nr:Uncharacterised protein [uncultured archaeon]
MVLPGKPDSFSEKKPSASRSWNAVPLRDRLEDHADDERSSAMIGNMDAMRINAARQRRQILDERSILTHQIYLELVKI